MAEQDTPPLPPSGGENPDDAPRIATLAQYVKDLSVENPNSPTVFQWKGQPQIDVNFNIAVNPVGEDVREVVLKIEANASSEEGAHFVVDLTYGGLYGFRNIAEEQLHPFFYVDAPTMLFPFARKIIADAVSDSGFPPLLMDMIDFRRAYIEQMQAQQAPDATNGSPETAPPTAEA